MSIEHLHSIRSAELERIIPILTDLREKMAGRNPAILELGSGTGWQAKQLSERGFDVEAIDIESSKYAADQLWPITNYDGENIPFPDKHFDVLLSSNVLEHIPHLETFHSEMQRVLKPNGIAIHIVPSGTWRIWTNIAHYPFVLKTAIQKLSAEVTQKRVAQNDGVERKNVKSASTLKEMLRSAVFPSRHGETGNAISEIYHFSRINWSNLLKRNGWMIKRVSGNRLFYTGYMVFGTMLPCNTRTLVSQLLGSSCHIFVLQLDSD